MFLKPKSPRSEKWMLFGVLVGVLSIQLPFLNQNPTGFAEFAQTQPPSEMARPQAAATAAPTAAPQKTAPSEENAFNIKFESCGPKAETCNYTVSKLAGVNNWVYGPQNSRPGSETVTVNVSPVCLGLNGTQVAAASFSDAQTEVIKKGQSYCDGLKSNKPQVVAGSCFKEILDESAKGSDKRVLARFQVEECGRACEEKSGDEKLSCHKEKLLELSITSLPDNENSKTAINLYFNKYLEPRLNSVVLNNSFRFSRSSLFDIDNLDDTKESTRQLIEELLEDLKATNGFDVKRNLVKLLAKDLRQQAVESVKANNRYDRLNTKYENDFAIAISNDGLIDPIEAQQLNILQQERDDSYYHASSLWVQNCPLCIGSRSLSYSATIQDLLQANIEDDRTQMRLYDRVLNEDFRIPTRDFVSAYGNRSTRPNLFLDPVPSLFGGRWNDDFLTDDFGRDTRDILNRENIRGGSLSSSWLSQYNLPGLRSYRDSTLSGSRASRVSLDLGFLPQPTNRLSSRFTNEEFKKRRSALGR